MAENYSEHITDNPLTTFAAIKFLCSQHLGTFSNGDTAAWLQGKPFDHTAMSVSGCLLIMNEDYLTRSRKELLADQINFEGVYRLEIIQYDHDDQSVLNRRSLKHKLTTALDHARWQPSTPLRGQYPRAMVDVGFGYIANRCMPIPRYIP